jgi:hypothetical protein
MRTGLLVLSMRAVTACASIPTGSFLPEERCTTAAERAAARRQQDVLIDARSERDSGIR